jgi:hypothetical protein
MGSNMLKSLTATRRFDLLAFVAICSLAVGSSKASACGGSDKDAPKLDLAAATLDGNGMQQMSLADAVKLAKKATKRESVLTTRGLDAHLALARARVEGRIGETELPMHTASIFLNDIAKNYPRTRIYTEASRLLSLIEPPSHPKVGQPVSAPGPAASAAPPAQARDPALDPSTASLAPPAPGGGSAQSPEPPKSAATKDSRSDGDIKTIFVALDGGTESKMSVAEAAAKAIAVIEKEGPTSLPGIYLRLNLAKTLVENKIGEDKLSAGRAAGLLEEIIANNDPDSEEVFDATALTVELMSAFPSVRANVPRVAQLLMSASAKHGPETVRGAQARYQLVNLKTARMNDSSPVDGKKKDQELGDDVISFTAIGMQMKDAIAHHNAATIIGAKLRIALAHMRLVQRVADSVITIQAAKDCLDDVVRNHKLMPALPEFAVKIRQNLEDVEKKSQAISAMLGALNRANSVAPSASGSGDATVVAPAPQVGLVPTPSSAPVATPIVVGPPAPQPSAPALAQVAAGAGASAAAATWTPLPSVPAMLQGPMLVFPSTLRLQLNP